MTDVKTAFINALDMHTDAERQAYLNSVFSDNAELCEQVEALLHSHNTAHGFLDSEVFGWQMTGEQSSNTEGTGTVIDRYTLMETVGEGGMAVVYKAHQKSPLSRLVALKLIKQGMDSKQVIARFEAERQALAVMNHPNIARVFDAGTTETGRPYFVMEYVEGVSVTQFCDTHQMRTRERLGLFLVVCQAVQHAHQKGIIHRDIKPSNVMVTLRDGQPVPMVIDFGIAKATNQCLTEKTLFTHHAQIMGTPGYMSPEQAHMSVQDVDTRTDVYSLGVLLYELLTGQPPFDAADLKNKSFSEIERIIREQEPLRPSTRLAQQLASDPSKIENSKIKIDRDLDWIVMKTLEKDRDRRYSSVSEFAADIQRHLKHEPVLAGRPSTWYCLKKYVRRHRSVVTTLIAVGTALLIGLALNASLYNRVKLAMNAVDTLETQAKVDQCVSRAQRLHAQGSLKTALDEIEPLILAGVTDANAFLLHGQILFDLGSFDEAKAQLTSLVTAESQIAGTAHYLLSQILQRDDPVQAQMHREETDRLKPKTADAYYLRARTVETPDEALQLLNQALQLKPGHYAARESRALIHAGLHDYIKMQQDAEAITALRSEDYMGYALRALAQRELGDLAQALPDHTRAIELCDIDSELPVLLDQRQETYWRMENYQAALQDAQQCVSLDPNNVMYRTTLAKIFYAMKQYDQVKKESDVIQDTFGGHFLATMSRFMSDATVSGKSIEMPNNLTPMWSGSPSPSFYLPTVASLFDALGSRAARIVRGAYNSSAWSPDGQELAYTRSDAWRWDNKAQGLFRPNSWSGYRGIEVLDLESGHTRVLTSSGGSPAWSSDGRFIAFVRAADHLYGNGEEIWLIPARGGTAQRLVAGSWPSWTNHASRLYYVSPVDEMLCYVDVNQPSLPPTQVVPCPGQHMQVSPNERFLAYAVAGELTILELATGKKLVKWVVPGPGLNFVRWSPDGKEISLGIGWIQTWPSGLWIFDVEQRQGRHVLDPMALSCNWSSDRSHLALDLAYPVSEIWLAKVDPDLPTWDVLGGGQTRGEYLQKNWHKHIQSSQFFTQRVLRNVTAVAINQYELKEYDDALWTLQHIAEIPEVQGTLPEAQTMAYMAMALTHLDRHEEARQILSILRILCAQGEITDETCLYEAEKVLAAKDSTLVSIWQCLQEGQLKQALDLVEAVEMSQSVSAQAETVQSARRALAHALYEATQNATHQGHEPHRVLAGYEAVLHADPNHVQSLRELAVLLATCADADVRNGDKARLYAQKACELTDYQDPSSLASLAVASAECGDFSAAVKWQKEALKQYPKEWSNHELVARLNLYESGQHVHLDKVEPLVAWWPFTSADSKGGFIQDASGHGLQAKFIGDAKMTNDPDRGHVLSLDGNGDWVDCGQNAQYNFVSEISISMWIKVKTFDSPYQAIITKGNHAWEFLRRPFGGMVGFHCQGLEVQSNELGVLVGHKELDDDQWHHLVGVYNGTRIYQYIDGELDTSAPARGKINLDNGPVCLGKSQPFPGSTWNGRMDEVRIYNHALSLPEIKALYEGKDPLP
ncbi:MAG: protein kinase [Phycisphaerae bacterium]|nr:protein kinase [Phycisphaerae bacterium]